MSGSFRRRTRAALADARLQRALANVPRGFIAKRARALAALPEFERLREEASAVKRHVLDNLDEYLEAFGERARAAGARVHMAADAAAARRVIIDILKGIPARGGGAPLVVKGKSMISEEVELNAALEGAGFKVVETDLGEYIIQLRGEKPSHIVAPAIHLTRAEIEPAFRAAHGELPPQRRLAEREDFVNEARGVLRRAFTTADAGITGANLLIAESGSLALVTNEGNGDLCATLPRVHIVLASIDKLVPTREDASLVLRLLARSATGQEITSYTSFFTGPARRGDADGPREMHIVLLDNGRRRINGGEFSDILKCIRCAACINHCPVFAAVGGHAYGGVYPGPMGEVLTPALHGIREETAQIVDACTMCGRCAEVCPMGIPLPALIRKWRARAFEGGAVKPGQRAALKGWAWLARRGRLHGLAAGMGARLLRLAGKLAADGGEVARLPGLAGWQSQRALPAPPGRTFSAMWKQAAPPAQPPARRRRAAVMSGGEAREQGGESPRQRMKAHPRSTIPARARVRGAAAVKLFVEMAEKAAATVERLGDIGEAPAAVAAYLERRGLPGEVTLGGGKMLASLDWAGMAAGGGMAADGEAAGGIRASVTEAFCAIAETGTVMLLSGPDNPVRLNFLPEVHVVVVNTRDIVGGYEEAWDRLRREMGEGAMPRTVNWITGPSRTADIEQTLILGAHGPRALHVLLTDG